MKAFRIMGRTFKSTYEELFLVVILSILWWIGTLLVVTAPMTTVGLQNVANRIANYKRADTGFFWEGTRSHVGRGVLLFLLVILAPPLIWFSVTFYLQAADWMIVLAVVMVWFLIIFAMAAQYMFPLFWQQTSPTFGLTLRNAFVLALRHPLYSILILLFQVVLMALSVVLVVPVLLLLPGMIALCQNHALVGLLQEMGLGPAPPEMSGT